MEQVKVDICRFRLLYVDDEPATQPLIGRMLRMSHPDMEVIFADTTINALRVFREYKPDIVVVDLTSPALSGLLICEIISGRFKESPIIALTGCGSKKLIDKIVKMGINEYLDKPIHIDSLIAKINTIAENIFWERVRHTANSKFSN
jgi:DNA-binding response OmpR family regulator